MKLYLAILLLLSTFTSFSQTEDKDILLLLDSIKSIDPYLSLNKQVNELQDKNVYAYRDLRHLREKYEELAEFYIRQDLYRKAFDEIELGIIPDQTELKLFNDSKRNQNWYFDDWSLVQFPKSDSKPIIIYIEEITDLTMQESQYLDKYPIKDLGLSLYNGDIILKQRYPKIYAMIKNGKIVFQFLRLTSPIMMAMEIPRLQFPSDLSNNSNKSLKSKQKYANDLLTWISNDLSRAMISIDSKSDVLGDYIKIEKKAYSKPTIDEKITLRLEYIEFVKKKFKMAWE